MRLKPAQIAVIVVALGAGGLAAMLMGTRRAPEPQVIRQEVARPAAPEIRTVDVLVARVEIPMGRSLQQADVEWRRWPEDAANQHFIVRRQGDNGEAAMREAVGSIARSAFVAGEPLRSARLVRGTRGFMSAILPQGQRAMAVPIDDPSRGAGAFILPNDRVDIILTRRATAQAAASEGMTHSTSTILRNIRVLAVDQIIEERNGERAIVGRTATLELTPVQTETIALARELGTLSLALRSLADAALSSLAGGDPSQDGDGLFGARSDNGRLSIVRFGVRSVTNASGSE